MGKPQKKGEKGSAANFVTRSRALKKLQLSLSEFRKLCILKGIYPREPKKKPKGADKTYYFLKDIQFMLHDPLINKLRELRAWRQKVKKAKARRDKEKLEMLYANKPAYNLNHLVKERYPTFIDALRDLDDALCLIHLFAEMPSNSKISPETITNCQHLCKEFQYYIVKTNALRKVFLSIKGIYYQAEIFGQTVTWITPYKFPQPTKRDVDYKVMKSFLEFYQTLMGFVNFKLFHSLGLSYPPKWNDTNDSGVFLRALIVENNSNSNLDKSNTQKKSEARIVTLDKALKQIENSEQETRSTTETKEETPQELKPNDQIDIFDEEQKKLIQQQEIFKTLFKNCVFFLSREVPRESLEFVILSFGGEVILDEDQETNKRITHQVVDNDFQKHRFLTREYVQPQWVYDSVNARVLLPVTNYVPGAKLPPHLSPFVDDETEGYVPAYRQKLERYIRLQQGEELDSEPETTNPSNHQNDNKSIDQRIEENSKTSSLEKSRNNDDNDEEDDNNDTDESDDDTEQAYQKELKAEITGNYTKNEDEEKKQRKKRMLAKLKQQQEEKQREEMAAVLLSQKKRKLLDRIKFGQRMRQTQIDKLWDKRRKLESGEAKVVRLPDDSTIDRKSVV